MEYKFIELVDSSTATDHQLKAAIEHNSKTYSNMSREVENIKKVNEAAKAKGKYQPIAEIKTFSTEQKTEEVFDQDFEEEVEYYSSEVKKLTEEQLKTDLVRALPSRKHYEYERILRRIQIELLKDCKDIKELTNIEKEARPQDIESFFDELKQDLAKIKAIDAELTRNPELVEEQVTGQENTLVFVPTSGGNIHVLEDLNSIEPGHYRQFAQLLQSIKDGTFTNVKKFNNNNNLNGLTEVRDLSNGGRVTFMRIDKNTYAIISAFIKKKKNSSGYQRMLATHYQSYNAAESKLKENLSNPEFLALQSDYEKEIFRKLNPTAITKPAIMKKVGE